MYEAYEHCFEISIVIEIPKTVTPCHLGEHVRTLI